MGEDDGDGGGGVRVDVGSHGDLIDQRMRPDERRLLQMTLPHHSLPAATLLKPTLMSRKTCSFKCAMERWRGGCYLARFDIPLIYI